MAVVAASLLAVSAPSLRSQIDPPVPPPVPEPTTAVSAALLMGLVGVSTIRSALRKNRDKKNAISKRGDTPA